MPALPNVPGVLKVQMFWAADTGPTANTIHHLRYTGGPPTAAQCVTMANSILGAAATDFAALMSNDDAVEAVVITDLSTASSAKGQSTAAATFGTRGTALLPPAAAALVNHSINRRYRGGHPRTYFPFGVSGDVMTVGTWTAAFVAAVNSAYTTWQAAVLAAGSGCTLNAFTNVSYYEGFTPVQNPITQRWRNVAKPRGTALLDDITGSACATKIGSQRRRNRNA